MSLFGCRKAGLGARASQSRPLRPGDLRAARYHLKIIDPVWRYAYGPMARWMLKSTATLNHLQFLTIRQYLSLVFVALVVLLLVLSVWN